MQQREIVKRRSIILKIKVSGLWRRRHSVPGFEIIEDGQNIGAFDDMAKHYKQVVCVIGIKEGVVCEVDKPLRACRICVTTELRHGNRSIRVAEFSADSKFIGDIAKIRH